MCFHDDKCISYNLGPVEGEITTCELNEVDHVTHSHDVIDKQGYKYCPIKVHHSLTVRNLRNLMIYILETCSRRKFLWSMLRNIHFSLSWNVFLVYHTFCFKGRAPTVQSLFLWPNKVKRSNMLILVLNVPEHRDVVHVHSIHFMSFWNIRISWIYVRRNTVRIALAIKG